jgi:hypothetical protein
LKTKNNKKQKPKKNKNMKAKFRNFTPHDVKLNSGEVFKSEGIARIAASFTPFDENRICSQTFGEVYGLPEKQENTFIIVSALVLQAIDRDDLVAPATGHPECVRDERGQIISVPGFVSNSK